MNSTQVPIIMWESRYMSPTEEKLLQSMEKLRYLPESSAKAYEALGNAVNVRVVHRVAMALIGRAPTKAKVETTSEALEDFPAHTENPRLIGLVANKSTKILKLGPTPRPSFPEKPRRSSVILKVHQPNPI
jgi:hypothetical protein